MKFYTQGLCWLAAKLGQVTCNRQILNDLARDPANNMNIYTYIMYMLLLITLHCMDVLLVDAGECCL